MSFSCKSSDHLRGSLGWILRDSVKEHLSQRPATYNSIIGNAIAKHTNKNRLEYKATFYSNAPSRSNHSIGKLTS